MKKFVAVLMIAALALAVSAPAAAAEVTVVSCTTTVIGNPAPAQFASAPDKFDGVILALSNGDKVTMLRTVTEQLGLRPGAVILSVAARPLQIAAR